MKTLKHIVNRVSCWIYFKSMSEHTLRRTVDKHVNTYWVEKLYGRYFKPSPDRCLYAHTCKECGAVIDA